MGMLGGVIAGAMSGGAEATGQIASQQIDLNNKQQFAQFQSGLEADRQAQAMRLAQTIGVENENRAASPEVQARTNANAAAAATSRLQNEATPENIAAQQKIDAAKPIQVGPMHTVVTQQPDGTMKEQYTNPNSPYLARAAASAANADARKNHYTAEELAAGSRQLETQLEKSAWKDPTGGLNPVAGAVAGQAFNDAVETPGVTPQRAAAIAYGRVAETMALIAKAKKAYPDQTKGQSDYDIYQTIQSARAPAGAAAPAGPKPTAPAPAAQPAAKDPTATMGNPEPEPEGVLAPQMNPQKRADRMLGKRPAAPAAPVNEAQMKTDAANAIATLKPGDIQGAAAIQDGPLWPYLTRDQKVQISNLVNGR